MDHEKILSKIKKCLALGKSNNPNEAAIALAQAHSLMSKYNITQTDVNLSAVNETGARIDQRSNPPGYISILANAIASIMGCERFIKPGRKAEMIFIGVAPNDQLAAYAFDTLSRKLKASRKDFMATNLKRVRTRSSKTRRADIYCQGWVMAVDKAVRNLKVDVPELVGQYMVKTHPDLVTKSSRMAKVSKRNCDLDALLNGIEAGSSVDLNKPVTGSNERKLLQ